VSTQQRARTKPSTDRIEREILLRAPRARVWRASSNAEEFGNWFGVALKGGAFSAGQRVRGNITYPGYEHFVFDVLIERVEPERTLSWRWHPYAVDPKVDYSKEPTTLVVFELKEVAGGTRLSVVESGFDQIPLSRRAEAFRMNSGGWDEQMKNIERHLMPTESMQPFVISRLFDAPRERVWQAWTEPERLKQWWGPKGFKVHTCKVDLRPGGTFLYGMKGPDGSDMWGKFVYREIQAPEKLVFVLSFSDPKGGVTRHPGMEDWPLQTLSAVEFSESGGKTKVTVSWLPHEASEAERKVFDQGRESMKQGWSGTFDQLAAYLKK
jgi:uncharacterized protein YndB with AHSA1/START domain